MASKASVAIQQEAVFSRLESAAAKLSKQYGVDAPVLPTQGRNPDLLHVQQMESIVAFIELIADQDTPALGKASENTVKDALPPKRVVTPPADVRKGAK